MTTQQAPADLFPVIATPDGASLPPAGYVYLYPKADGNFYIMSSSGAETMIGVGSGIAVGSGASFPASPKLGDEFYRTDIDKWFKYSIGSWMSI